MFQKCIFGHYLPSRCELSPVCGFFLPCYYLCTHNDTQLLLLQVRVVIMDPQKWSFRSEKCIFGHYWPSRSEASPLCGFLLTYYSLCIHNDIQLLLLPVRVVIRDLWTLKCGHLCRKSVFLAIIEPSGLNCHHCVNFFCHATPYVYKMIPNYYTYQ